MFPLLFSTSGTCSFLSIRTSRFEPCQLNVPSFFADPRSQLPIYGQSRIAEHSGMQHYQLEPHVYGVAENMYKQVWNGEMSL